MSTDSVPIPCPYRTPIDADPPRLFVADPLDVMRAQRDTLLNRAGATIAHTSKLQSKRASAQRRDDVTVDAINGIVAVWIAKHDGSEHGAQKHAARKLGCGVALIRKRLKGSSHG